MKNKTTLWITQTAVFVALLVALQFVTAPLGNTLITGSIVNFLLVMAVMTVGLSSGLCVAAISPVMAKLAGIGPLWSLLPFIAVGNCIFVLLWHLIGKRHFGGKIVPYLTALGTASLAKFLTLYLGIVKFAVPVLLKLPTQQAAVFSVMFSLPQLLTAMIGGGAALLVLPALNAARRKQ